MITNTSARPMCNFLSIHVWYPPPLYQKAGYATDEPLTEEKKNREPPKVFAPPQSKTASGAPGTGTGTGTL